MPSPVLFFEAATLMLRKEMRKFCWPVLLPIAPTADSHMHTLPRHFGAPRKKRVAQYPDCFLEQDAIHRAT